MLPLETGVSGEKRGAEEQVRRLFVWGCQSVFTLMALLGPVDVCVVLKVGPVSRIPVAS